MSTNPDHVEPVSVGIYAAVGEHGTHELIGVIDVTGERDPHGSLVPNYGDVSEGLRMLADAVDDVRNDPEAGEP